MKPLVLGEPLYRNLAEPLYVKGGSVFVTGMPSYGAMPVIYVKASSVSGWWYELRDENGGTWVIPEHAIEGEA